MNSYSYKFIPTVTNKDNTRDQQWQIDKEIGNCEIRFLHSSTLWLNELYLSLNFSNCLIQTYETELINSLGLYYPNYRFCRNLFLKSEFKRCAYHLEKLFNKNPILDFIYFYAKYKAVVKLMRENDSDWGELETHKLGLEDMISLKEDIDHYLRKKKDSYIRYLYGLTLFKLKLNDLAENAFIESLKVNPYFWGAWVELLNVFKNSKPLPDVWMRSFFDVKFFRKINNKHEGDVAINYMLKNNIEYENFNDLKIDLAIINEQKNNSVYSLELLDEVQKKDPCRIDYFKNLSNILFIQENHSRLSSLAKQAVKLNKYSAEACVSMGNLFSLRNDHEKAVVNFQRALKIEPNNAMIMVLTAHEYTELENYHAAMKFYSKAIEIDPSNHKALYSLAQLYEMFKAHKFALSCYELAFKSAPNDSRILVAMGSVYEELDRLEEAKTVYSRAHAVGDMEGIALFKLGRIYDKLKDSKNAAASFNLYVNKVYKEGFSEVRNLGEACRYLAIYHLNTLNNREQSRYFAQKCMDVPDTRIDGEELLRKINNLDIKGNSSNEYNDEHYAVLDPFDLSSLPRFLLNDTERANSDVSIHQAEDADDNNTVEQEEGSHDHEMTS